MIQRTNLLNLKLLKEIELKLKMNHAEYMMMVIMIIMTIITLNLKR